MDVQDMVTATRLDQVAMDEGEEQGLVGIGGGLLTAPAPALAARDEAKAAPLAGDHGVLSETRQKLEVKIG